MDITFAPLNVKAPRLAWTAFGVQLHGSNNQFTVMSAEHAELLFLGTIATNTLDQRAVAWAIGERQRRLELKEERRVHGQLAAALADLASAIDRLPTLFQASPIEDPPTEPTRPMRRETAVFGSR